jgi:hypothetical protein
VCLVPLEKREPSINGHRRSRWLPRHRSDRSLSRPTQTRLQLQCCYRRRWCHTRALYRSQLRRRPCRRGSRERLWYCRRKSAVKDAIRLGAHSVEHGYIMDDECVSQVREVEELLGNAYSISVRPGDPRVVWRGCQNSRCVAVRRLRAQRDQRPVGFLVDGGSSPLIDRVFVTDSMTK